MFKKNEMFKTAILTGLVLFATIGLFTIVLAPGGTMSPAQALRRTMPTGGGLSPGAGGQGTTACNGDSCN